MDDEGTSWRHWDSAYTEGWAPWDIGRPQPAFVRLADAGKLPGPALDCGCGTGENTLMLAARGIDATGLDVAPTAIARARAKATERDLQATFVVGDALHLERLARSFRSVVDCGLFHGLGDEARVAYVASLFRVVELGGSVNLLCFSDLTPQTHGPRRVSQAEIRAAFADGWRVERIEPERFDVVASFSRERPHAWLARIVRA